MKVLLIGGTGVLSRDICKFALSQKMDVYLLNRGNRSLEIPSEAVFLKADIRDVKAVEERLGSLEFDVVIDFLSFTPEQMKASLPLFKDRCKQYIFISSATAYSIKARDFAITENSDIGNELWDYGNNKALCEEFLRYYCNDCGLHYTIIRPYVTYGDTRIPFAVISGKRKWSLVNRILQGKPVVMWDDGSAICTLTHTLDFAVGIVGLFGNPQADNQAFHITSDEHYTWNEVLEMIAKAVGKEANVVNIPSVFIGNEMAEYRGLLVGDKATNMVFDNSKIKAVVPEFECQINFEEGISRAIAYHRNHPEWMKVDYEWEARIDRLIAKYCKQHNSTEISARLLRYIPATRWCFQDWFAYETSKHGLCFDLLKIARKLKAKLKR